MKLKRSTDFGLGLNESKPAEPAIIKEAEEAPKVFKAVTPGKIEIHSGTDARSAEVMVDDVFEVTSEDTHWYLGKLVIQGKFQHDPGLSGKNFTPHEVDHNGVVFALRKANIDGKSDFFAQFTEVKPDEPVKESEINEKEWKMGMNISAEWDVMKNIDVKDPEQFEKAKAAIVNKLKGYADKITKKLGKDEASTYKSIVGRLKDTKTVGEFHKMMHKLFDFGDDKAVSINLSESVAIEEKKLSDAASKWISDKIAKLREEGKDEAQAAAIAYSMAKEKGYDVPTNEAKEDDSKEGETISVLGDDEAKVISKSSTEATIRYFDKVDKETKEITIPASKFKEFGIKE